MKEKPGEPLDPQITALYHEYVRGRMERRDLLKSLGRAAGGAAAASSMLALLEEACGEAHASGAGGAGLESGAQNSPGEAAGLMLELTYPAGKSPKVFTEGWIFGARCVMNQGRENEQDISDQVQWSGRGSFDPPTGKTSRPRFEKQGENLITLSVSVGGIQASREYKVEAVSPFNYARIDHYAHCPADAHGCPSCPHVVQGPIISGSPTVLVDNLPAARVGDHGIHSACCGPNTFEIAQGDPDVLIDGKPAARIGDMTLHCGGTGKIVGHYSRTTTKTSGPVWTAVETRINPADGHSSTTMANGGREEVNIPLNLSSYLYTRSEPGLPERRNRVTWKMIPATPPWTETQRFEFTPIPKTLVPGQDFTLTVTGLVTTSGDAPNKQAHLRITASEKDPSAKTGSILSQDGSATWELLVSAGQGPVTRAYTFSVPREVTPTRIIEIRVEGHWGSIYRKYAASQ